jgi:isopenicillin-N epimerase
MSESIWSTMKARYMVPPDLVYLNNGSFGPAPRPVYEALVRYLRALEENPSMWGEQNERVIKVVVPRLAAFVGSDPDFTAMVTNLTMGMNVFARGLRGLGAGDEILTTNQEYGAVLNVWDYVAKQQGLAVNHVHIPVPNESPEEIVKIIEAGITPRTRVILCSHVTTTTGLVLPVKEISALAHSRGILTVIDGAHAPGMIRVNIRDIGCDFYTGNCHKWLGAPKGTAFVAMHPRAWDRVDPFIVGWGWNKETKESFEGNFETPGIHNTALSLAVHDAVQFQEEIGTEAIEARGRQLAEYGKDVFTRLPGVKLLTPRNPALCGSIASYSLPPLEDGARMADAFKKRNMVIVAGANSAGGRMRLSTHIYNSEADVDLVDEAMRESYGL